MLGVPAQHEIGDGLAEGRDELENVSGKPFMTAASRRPGGAGRNRAGEFGSNTARPVVRTGPADPTKGLPRDLDRDVMALITPVPMTATSG